jgi:hypothetical protein
VSIGLCFEENKSKLWEKAAFVTYRLFISAIISLFQAVIYINKDPDFMSWNAPELNDPSLSQASPFNLILLFALPTREIAVNHHT